jgi:hypothetical protein
MGKVDKPAVMYGAAYQLRTGQWSAVAIGITPGGAVDAAIHMYDASKSFETYGWDVEWPRDRKATFLRRRGMRVKKFLVVEM